MNQHLAALNRQPWTLAVLLISPSLPLVACAGEVGGATGGGNSGGNAAAEGATGGSNSGGSAAVGGATGGSAAVGGVTGGSNSGGSIAVGGATGGSNSGGSIAVGGATGGSNSGGSVAVGGATGGGAAVGGATGGSNSGGSTARLCQGNISRPGAGGAGVPLTESIQCYVANTGESCLPVSDPTLVSRVADQVSSCGYFVEFVIDAAEEAALPIACDQLVQCCDAVFAAYRPRCYDAVDSATLAMDNCRANLSGFASQCPGVGAASDGGAGDASTGGSGADSDAGVSSRYKACCYYTCQYFGCI